MTSAIASPLPVPDFRENAHDLRNLFGVIASAGHMLADGADEARRTVLLDAIEDAATRGAALATRMLSTNAVTADGHAQRLDVTTRLRRLEPLLRSIVDGDHRLTIEADGAPAIIRAAPDRFDHVVLELVANARNALARPGTIHVRVRIRRGAIRLMVADTGCGLSAAARDALLHATPIAGVHGTGFQQVRRFVRDAHGTLRLRSTPGRGTVVLVDLPALLRIGAAT